MTRSRRSSLLTTLVALTLAAAGLAIQEGDAASIGVPPRPGDRVEWYTVQPGDHLSAITQRFLGVANLWPENQRLNPGIRPNALRVGQRIRVITYRPNIERSAEVVIVNRRVDQRQNPRDWQSATVGDVLKQDDAVRTHRRSNAALEFDDGHELRIGEQSLVLLRQIGQRLTGEKQQTIEIVEGAADLERAARAEPSAEIEVILGGAIAKPTPASSGVTSSRLQSSGDGAAIMVYDGSSSLASGGAQVQVDTGMGSTAKDGVPPTPPEKLLPRPEAIAPTSSAVNHSNPLLRWSQVAGAVSYRVEVCADRECAQVLEQAETTELEWRSVDGLLAGQVAWRVRGVAASGLEGYPSRVRQLEVQGPGEEAGRDLHAPALVVAVEGAGSAIDAVRSALGPGGRLRLYTHDDLSGVENIEWAIDQGPWRTLSGDFLEPPEDVGLYLVRLRISDRAGRTTEYQHHVARAVEAPAPPSVPVIRE